MPDIDIDFEPERRSEVFDYVVRKYGKENVARSSPSVPFSRAAWCAMSEE